MHSIGSGKSGLKNLWLIHCAYLAALFAPSEAMSQSNIDPAEKFAWSENAGWTNWHDAGAGAAGAQVGSFVLSGYLWAENVGFINLGNGAPAEPPYYGNETGADFGANIAPDGTIFGLAWGENIGWISFEGGAMASPTDVARIVCGGNNGVASARLTGYAWGENVGWINLSDLTPTRFVRLTQEGTPIPCDINGDGDVDGADVRGFVAAVLAGADSWTTYCAGDVGSPADGLVDISDVPAFVECLLTRD